MRRLTTLLTTLLLATAMGTQAQPAPADELRRDPTRSASNLATYPGPGDERLTPPPRVALPVEDEGL